MSEDNQEQHESQPIPVSRVIGWVVMGLVMFGGAAVRGLNRIFNGALPSDLHISLIVGVLVFGAVAWVGLALWRRGNSSNAPMPPFGGGSQPWQTGQPSQPVLPQPLPPEQTLLAPRFDPLINPRVLVVGVVGLVLVALLALALMAGGML